MSNPAFEILRRLVLEISDPKVPNAEAAVRACREAMTAYPNIREGIDAVQEPSPKKKVSPPSPAGENVKKDAPGVGELDAEKGPAGEAPLPENLQRKSTKRTYGALTR